MPNINDSFSGEAADLGAYEVGQPLPPGMKGARRHENRPSGRQQ